MYYEARIHQIIEVTNAMAAAEKIKNGNIPGYQVMKWISSDEKFYMYAVPDGHIDNILLELAILKQAIESEGAPYQQVESITNGWIGDAEILGRFLEAAESSDIIMHANAQLILDKPNGHEIATFTCGCCGNWFKGNVQKQLTFGQDTGYGICDECQLHWY